jgi:hypothetical protein
MLKSFSAVYLSLTPGPGKEMTFRIRGTKEGPALLPSAYCRPPTADCLLPTAYCILLTAPFAAPFPW